MINEISFKRQIAWKDLNKISAISELSITGFFLKSHNINSIFQILDLKC